MSIALFCEWSRRFACESGPKRSFPPLTLSFSPLEPFQHACKPRKSRFSRKVLAQATRSYHQRRERRSSGSENACFPGTGEFRAGEFAGHPTLSCRAGKQLCVIRQSPPASDRKASRPTLALHLSFDIASGTGEMRLRIGHTWITQPRSLLVRNVAELASRR